MRWVGLALMLAAVQAAAAAKGDALLMLHEAQFVLGEAATAPGDEAAW